MKIQKTIGRPPKVTYTTMLRLADAIQYNSTITEACRWSGISTTTFFYYMRSNEVFAEKMHRAKQNQNKAVFSFSTYF
jgi:hypothetical protein